MLPNNVRSGQQAYPVPGGQFSYVPGGQQAYSAPEGQSHFVPGGQQAYSAPGGQYNFVPGGQYNFVPGGQYNSVPGGQNTSNVDPFSGGQFNFVPGGQQTYPAPGGQYNFIPGNQVTSNINSFPSGQLTSNTTSVPRGQHDFVTGEQYNFVTGGQVTHNTYAVPRGQHNFVPGGQVTSDINAVPAGQVNPELDTSFDDEFFSVPDGQNHTFAEQQDNSFADIPDTEAQAELFDGEELDASLDSAEIAGPNDMPGEGRRGRKAGSKASKYVLNMKKRAAAGDVHAALKLGWSVARVIFNINRDPNKTQAERDALIIDVHERAKSQREIQKRRREKLKEKAAQGDVTAMRSLKWAPKRIAAKLREIEEARQYASIIEGQQNTGGANSVAATAYGQVGAFHNGNLQASNFQGGNSYDTNVQARNTQANNFQDGNIQGGNIQSGNIQACNAQTSNAQARNVQARNVQARNVQARNVQAGNLQAPVQYGIVAHGSTGQHFNYANYTSDTPVPSIELSTSGQNGPAHHTYYPSFDFVPAVHQGNHPTLNGSLLNEPVGAQIGQQQATDVSVNAAGQSHRAPEGQAPSATPQGGLQTQQNASPSFERGLAAQDGGVQNYHSAPTSFLLDDSAIQDGGVQTQQNAYIDFLNGSAPQDGGSTFSIDELFGTQDILRAPAIDDMSAIPANDFDFDALVQAPDDDDVVPVASGEADAPTVIEQNVGENVTWQNDGIDWTNVPEQLDLEQFLRSSLSPFSAPGQDRDAAPDSASEQDSDVEEDEEVADLFEEPVSPLSEAYREELQAEYEDVLETIKEMVERKAELEEILGSSS